MSLVKLPQCLLASNHQTCVVLTRILLNNAKVTSVVPCRYYPKVKKKNQNVKKLAVDIRSNMKVKDLARQIQIPIAEVLESLEECTGEEKYTKEDDKIESVALLKQVVRKHGLNFKLKTSEKKKTTENVMEESEQTQTAETDQQPVTETATAVASVSTGVSRPPLILPRTPIVTIMGHVDHGKTTLLDALRASSIVDQEFGGITQHIGAFMVKMASGATITFLDTPGHAAFSSMRSRGASVTDMVVLVVAADDSVMNQTVESIRHAKEANVPIIVAINKIDKPGANVERTKENLAEHGVIVEEFGGDVQAVSISALKKVNIDLLEECITTQAEVLDLKADHNADVSGSVIESKTEPGRGRIATVIIKSGILRVGDILMAGDAWAKVRAMQNEHGQEVQEGLPGMPVEVTGWRDLPSAGDPFNQVKSEREVKAILSVRAMQQKEEELLSIAEEIDEQRKEDYKKYRAIREEKLDHLKEWGRFCSIKRYLARNKGIIENHIELNKRTLPSFPIIVKCDVDGSLDAIMDILGTFQSQMCTLDIMDYGVGDITEQDIQMAQTFSGQIYAFNVDVSSGGQTLAHDVPIKHFNIIYKMMDDLVDSVSSILPPKISEKVLGEAVVLKEFTITLKKKKVPIGGCKCTKGVLESDKNFRVVREDKVIYTGPLMSLRHHKSEVKSIKAGVECGLCIDPESGVKVEAHDQIVCYDHIAEPQRLDWEPPGFQFKKKVTN